MCVKLLLGLWFWLQMLILQPDGYKTSEAAACVLKNNQYFTGLQAQNIPVSTRPQQTDMDVVNGKMER